MSIRPSNKPWDHGLQNYRSMKTKNFIWESLGSNLCSSLYFWWACCDTQKMCAWSKNSQEWRLYTGTSTGNVSRADIGSEAKITRKINWPLSKQKDLLYSTIIMMRLPANRCVLEISHQPESPDLEPAEFFVSYRETTFNQEDFGTPRTSTEM